MSSIIKASQNTYEKIEAFNNFEQLMEIFNLTDYQKIQILTKESCFTNSSFDNCTKKIKTMINRETLGFHIFYGQIKDFVLRI